MSNPHAHPRLRPSVSAAYDGETIVLTALADGVVHEYDSDDRAAEVVRSLDGTRTPDELRASYGDVVDEVLAVLDADGLLADRRPLEFDPRWSNQVRFLDDLQVLTGQDGPSAHERLRSGHVAIIGTGGVGSWVVQMLAAAGVGKLTVIDPDRVESSNLNRQVLFGVRDVGRAKVDAVQEYVAGHFPETAIVPVVARIDAVTDLDEIVRAGAPVDVVVCCADEPSVLVASSVVAEAAHRLGMPHIVGGGYGAAVGAPGYTVVPGSTPCWSCAVRTTAPPAEKPMRDVTPAGPSAGSFAPLIGLTGAITAWEACRLLVGLEPRLARTVREIDMMSLG